jgi:hypothetical protein
MKRREGGVLRPLLGRAFRELLVSPAAASAAAASATAASATAASATAASATAASKKTAAPTASAAPGKLLTNPGCSGGFLIKDVKCSQADVGDFLFVEGDLGRGGVPGR